MHAAAALAYTSLCSRCHRFPPNRRIQPFVDVTASGINITNAAADEIDKAFRDYTGETYVTKTEAGERE